MRIFVSYSFREENKWVDDYVIPLIRCFGHEPVTGRILDGAAIPDEVRRLIKLSRRVLCFVTRDKPLYKYGIVMGHKPPDWVRDELMLGRGAEKATIEFREKGVVYDGAAAFSAWHPFDRADLPTLLLRVADLLKDWPVGPLMLRLAVPQSLHKAFEKGVAAGTLHAKCIARDGYENDSDPSLVLVRKQNDEFIIPFWIKPNPSMAIEIEIAFGERTFVCKGISPSVCVVSLRQL